MRIGNILFFLIIILIGAGFLLSQYAEADNARRDLQVEVDRLNAENQALRHQVSELASQIQIMQAQLQLERQERASCQALLTENSTPIVIEKASTCQPRNLLDTMFNTLLGIDTEYLAGAFAAILATLGKGLSMIFKTHKTA